MKNKLYSVQFRRKREGRTDYRKRLKLIMSGKPRLVVRKSNKNISAQIITYSAQGDKVVAAANSRDLKKLGWIFGTKSICAAYLTGLLLGQKAKEKGIKEAVLDAGLSSTVKGNRIYSALKGVMEIISVPASQEILPDQKRLSGEHISNYMASIKGEGMQFSAYRKNKADPKKIPDEIEKIKQKIISKK